MTQSTDSGRLAEDFKGLLTKTIEADIRLFNRLSDLSAEAMRALLAGEKRKSFPSLGEGVSRFAGLSLSLWSSAASHLIGFASDVASAYEAALDLRPEKKEASRETKRPKPQK